jgi:adenosylhomocysteine nucleosidase
MKREPSPSAPLGLLCAMAEEIAAFGETFRINASYEIAGFRFLAGELDGARVVMAETGIGKVNAALAAGLMAARFDARGLMVTGVAGALAPDLRTGDWVVADRLIQHDYGAMIDRRLVRYQPGVPPLPGFAQTHGYGLDADLRANIHKALAGNAAPRFGTILSGDTFLNCGETREALFGETGALAIDMESAAVAQVAERFGLPWVALRAISDGADGDSADDFARFVHDAARHAAACVRRLVEARVL